MIRSRATCILLVAALLVLVMFVLGTLASLFGPSAGRWLSIVAFLSTIVLTITVDERRKRGTLRAVAVDRPGVRRLRPWLSGLMILLLVVVVLCLITQTMMGGDGVAKGNRPVFEHQESYRLNSHGNYTTVTRTRYVILGACFTVGWNGFLFLFTLVSLHMILFGDLPRGFNQTERDVGEAHDPPPDPPA